MKQLILIDDESLARDNIANILDWKELGYELVAMATNGVEGERLILKHQPQLVVTDVVMPGKSGLKMIHDLQGRTEANFIVLSGYQDFRYVRQALRIGVLDYVLKPVTKHELTLAVKRIKISQENIDPNTDEHFSGNLLVAQTQQLILDHLSDPSFNLKQLCSDYLFMNETYIGRLFHTHTGERFSAYLSRCRMETAKKLLQEHPNCTIGAIAQHVGFDVDGKYFSEVFRKYTGISPGAYRKQEMQKTDEIIPE